MQRAATEQLCCLSFRISLIDSREKTTAPPTLSASSPHPILSETKNIHNHLAIDLENLELLRL